MGTREANRAASGAPGRPGARHHTLGPVARPLALTLGLLLALALPLLDARSAAHGQGAEPLAVARAFDAAWNRHDLEAVVGFFAPEGVVRQASGVAEAGDAAGVVADDVYGARLHYDAGAAPFAVEGREAVWRGRAAVRAWARQLFAVRHRTEASGFALLAVPAVRGDGAERSEGAERDAGVGWRYRVFVAYDYFRMDPGVPPAEGTAFATVRGGVITALTLAGSADARRRRDDAMWDAAGAAPAREAPPPDAPPLPRPAAAIPTALLQAPMWGDAAWPLALAGLGAGAYALAAVRRRARGGRRWG